MTQVKICGLKRADHALAAVDAGADMLGFVFAPSPRQVLPRLARRMIQAARERSTAKTVGVFVNAEPTEMNRIARNCGLDYVQLSGDEPDDLVDALDVSAIQVVHVRPDREAGWLVEQIELSRAEVVLLDTAQPGAYGGTGHAFDWRSVPRIERPLVLAGGLHAGNVSLAIQTVRPWGVDVSSGVERNGEKDPYSIREFIAKVRSTGGTKPGKRALEHGGHDKASL